MLDELNLAESIFKVVWSCGIVVMLYDAGVNAFFPHFSMLVSSHALSQLMHKAVSAAEHLAIISDELEFPLMLQLLCSITPIQFDFKNSVMFYTSTQV